MMKRVVRRPDPPQAEIITTDDIREFCRIDADLDAVHLATLKTLRDAAIETGEQETGIIWRAAEYEITMPPPATSWSCLYVPVTPVLELLELLFVGPDAAEFMPAPATYSFHPSDLENSFPWATILPLAGGWPTGAERVQLLVKAGWTAETLPQSLRLWILNRIATSGDHRSDMQDSGRLNTVKMPREHSERLLDRWRVYGGASA